MSGAHHVPRFLLARPDQDLFFMPTWRRIGLSCWSDRVNAVPRSISVCDSAKRLIVMFKTSAGGEGAEKLSNAAELAIEKMELEKLESIRAELLDEYRQAHDWPWIIGYSGGKDSTLVAHLVFDMLLSLPPSQRRRPVHIVANDTLVESPLVVQHIIESMEEIGNAAGAFGLPIITKITRPAPDQSFWVNLIGRGYPSPNRSFRWCTDRMKILPTSRYIKSQVDEAGQVVRHCQLV